MMMKQTITSGQIDIRAGETPLPEPKKKTLIQRFKERINYDTKKMDVLMGQYDIDKRVVLGQNALIKATVYCAVTKKTHGNKEIMGWLAGKYDRDTIEIVDAYIGNCKSSTGYTELDPLETIKMNKMAKERGLKLVGQWHFHPCFSSCPSGIDDDFMRNIEKFGIKTPVQLIINLDDFSLTMMEKGHRKKVEFIVPPKIDNHLNINLGYINGEYTPVWGGDTTPFGSYGTYGAYPLMTGDGGEFPEVIAFFGWVGNKMLTIVSFLFPWGNIKQLVKPSVGK
jgi:proteasome lid subunit RPN8/RPN11